jgi:hypothetical protein
MDARHRDQVAILHRPAAADRGPASPAIGLDHLEVSLRKTRKPGALRAPV